MSELLKSSSPVQMRALCKAAQGTFPIEIEQLTPEGCTAQAAAEWEGDLDFLRLTLAGQAEINGRVVRHEGKVADIRFFGQISPLAIAAWQRRAA
jgi:hypothetical protein